MAYLNVNMTFADWHILQHSLQPIKQRPMLIVVYVFGLQAETIWKSINYATKDIIF